MELIGKSLLLLLIAFFVVPSVSYADNLDDNPLVPLMAGEKQRMRLEVDGMIPTPLNPSNRIELQSENLPHKFTVEASSFPVKSFLYIFTSEYSPASTWTVKFNGATIAKNIHSDSIGGDVQGDGKTSIRQTIFFDVTDQVSKGENTLTIYDIASSDPYYFDGAILLNFYQSDDEHQYWIYHGVEYIEHFEEFYKFDRRDAIYTRNFPFADYPVQSSATLYTVYHNNEEELDELKFNNQPLRDRDANFILDGSHLVAKTFDVSKSLDDNDDAVFTIKKFQAFSGATLRQYEDVPIYPSLVILETKPSVNSKVVVLANSIDRELAAESGLYEYIEAMDFDVVQASPEDFEKYRNHRFIIILGGPDAPEGVGDEVRAADVLDLDDLVYIRTKGNKHNFEARDVWTQFKNQFVWILAGSDREQTKQAHIDNRIRGQYILPQPPVLNTSAAR
jgi:hypothetical protein